MLNVLLCIDDFKGDYTRHCAVTILSLLETNKNHKIKIFIMSSCLPEENIKELKRIVKLYNQEIEFIIRDDIIPKEIKESVINRRNLTWGTYYRLFFPLYIKNIDRLLYMDCDVLVTKDIGEIYNMDMKGKAIVGYYEPEPSKYLKKQYFGIDSYINAGVILIDTKKYDLGKINYKNIKTINQNYGNWINDADQDYLNIIFQNNIGIYKKDINYIVERPFCNKGIKNATILHCLAKPYLQNSLSPKYVNNLYNKYLAETKWKGFPAEKRMIPYFGYLYSIRYWMIFLSLNKIFGIKIAAKYHLLHQSIGKYALKLLKNK